MSHTSEIMQAGLEGELSVFREVQLLCGFSDRQAADYCGVSLRTLRRWRNELSPSVSALKLLAIRAGAVPWPDWQGWELHSGHLFAPGMTRRGFTPGHLFAVTYLHALIAEQRRQIQELRAKLDQERAEGAQEARAV